MDIKNELRDIRNNSVWTTETIDKTYIFVKEVAIGFNDWLVLNCHLQPHGVWEFRGEEYTIEELFNKYNK